jgi:hypothetical protein
MTKKKFDPVVLRTMTMGNGKNIYRSQLLALEGGTRLIKIDEQSEKQNEVEKTEMRTTFGKRLVIIPDFTGIKGAEIEARAKLVREYVEKNGVPNALAEVGNEVVEPNKDNKNGKATVISWCPKIEKDLGFKTTTKYIEEPFTEEVKSIKIELEYEFKTVHENEVYFNVRVKDFIKYCQNFLANYK